MNATKHVRIIFYFLGLYNHVNYARNLHILLMHMHKLAFHYQEAKFAVINDWKLLDVLINTVIRGSYFRLNFIILPSAYYFAFKLLILNYFLLIYIKELWGFGVLG